MIARGSNAYKRLSSWAGENPVTLAFTAVGIGAVAAILAASALYFTDQVGQRVTRVEQSPCNRNPGGRACAQIRLEVAKAEPLRNPCASFQRVTSRRGRNCKQFFVPRQDAAASSSPSTSSDDGVAVQTQGGSGGEPAAPENPGGGHAPSPQHPGAQPGPGASPAPAAPPSEPAPVSEPPAATPPSGPIRSTVEEVLGGVRETACSLPLQLCP